MSHRFFPTLLHTKEWARIKKQAEPIEAENNYVDEREGYFDKLNKLSQIWIDQWPDSAEGIREKLEKQRNLQHKKDLQMLDELRNSKKHENKQEAVNNAKQIIFNDSCYGRQLISAVVESRTIDEREAQIAFKKEIEQKEADLVKDVEYRNSPLNFDSDKNRQEKRKQGALECVHINKEITLAQKEMAAKLKAEQNLCESVDSDMIKQLHDAKKKKKAEIALAKKKELEEYEAVRKDLEKHRKRTKDLDSVLTETYKKEKDTTKCKIDKVLKKLIEEKRHGERAIKFYKVIDELQKAEKKRFDDFIEKGIKMHDKKIETQEAKDIKMESKKQEERRKISQENKIAGENYKQYQQLTAPTTKCACDVQTLLFKPNSHPPIKEIEGNAHTHTSHRCDSEKGEDLKLATDSNKTKGKLSFLKPSDKLIKALKKRSKEPASYTGEKDIDQYFAQQATEALQNCNHKYFARRVVDQYLKLNCLKPSDLNIPNH